MPVEMRMWRIDRDEPRALSSSVLPTERELHQFLERDPSMLGTPLLVIGSEVITPPGKRLDLLAIDAEGNLHLLELKRDKTPRDVASQVLDYGAWASGLSRREIIDLANAHLDHPFEEEFERVFGAAPPDELNDELAMTIVATTLDPGTERIVTYLRTFGVPINAVFFSYLEDEGRRYLARSWFADDDGSTASSPASPRTRRRAPWNGVDWYVSFGGDRPWEDARRFGFVSAGGAKFSSQTMRSLPEGSRIWVNVPGSGYVGVGTTLGPARRFDDAIVYEADGIEMPLAEQDLQGSYRHSEIAGRPEADDEAEWVVPVEWIKTFPQSEAFWEKGMFGNQNSACKLRQEFTLERLAEHFDIED